jgi:hypothetical protein
VNRQLSEQEEGGEPVRLKSTGAESHALTRLHMQKAPFNFCEPAYHHSGSVELLEHSTLTKHREGKTHLDVHHVKAAIVEPGRDGKGAEDRAQQGEEGVDHTVVLLGQQDVVGVGLMEGRGLNAGESTVEGWPASLNVKSSSSGSKQTTKVTQEASKQHCCCRVCIG